MSGSAVAMVFTGSGQPLERREFDVPEPRGDEVLVRIIGCTLCGSDLHSFEGRRTVAVPMVLGHEILGRIVAVGPDAPRVDATGSPLAIGDRVTWSIVASCGRCYCCQRKLPQKCERMLKYGHERLRPGGEWTGGLADYCLLASGTAIVRVPDQLLDSVACPANCATATIAAAIESAGDMRGRRVLVAGAGLLGLTACAMARSSGATEVICLDTNRDRLARSEAFGATRVVGPNELASVIAACTEGRGVDVAFELSGSADACESILGSLGLGGRLVLVGAVFPTRPIPLLMEQVIRRHLTIVGIHNYAPIHLQQAVKFLASGQQFPFGEVVTDWLPLSEANRAFSLARNPASLRIGLRPDE